MRKCAIANILYLCTGGRETLILRRKYFKKELEMHDVMYYLEKKMSWHYKYSLSVRIYLTYLNNIPNSLTIIKAVSLFA